MIATTLHGHRDVRVAEVPDPTILRESDVVVRVVATCVCGSDLLMYREDGDLPDAYRMGHEFVGVVEAVGAGVTSIVVDDFVIAPFMISDGTCTHCRNGITSSCTNGGWWGADVGDQGFADAAQGERVRVPLADGTLVVVPGPVAPEEIPGLLALSDVMATGHHAAVSAGVAPGDTVVVVGDGAVGQCAIIAARRLGATTVIAMSGHPERQELARLLGATTIVPERGDAGVARVLELTAGVGADRVLECVGTKESMDQAIRSTRPGGSVGYVGVPHGDPELPIDDLFSRNVGVRGGTAPARAYIEELLPDVRSGAIRPGLVFDLELPLTEVAEGYRAMDERRAVKTLLRP